MQGVGVCMYVYAYVYVFMIAPCRYDCLAYRTFGFAGAVHGMVY